MSSVRPVPPAALVQHLSRRPGPAGQPPLGDERLIERSGQAATRYEAFDERRSAAATRSSRTP